MEWIVSIGDEKDIQTLSSQFIGIPYRSVYNYVLWRPFVAKLDIITSWVHLKLKYHNLQV